MSHSQHHSVEANYWHESVMEAHPTTTHTEHVIAYHVQGSLTLDHGQILQAEPGMITIVPAGIPHRSLGGQDIGIWLVSFCASCFQLDERHPLLAAFRQVRLGALPVCMFPPERRPLFLGYLQSLKEEAMQSTPESPMVVSSLLNLILAEVSRAMSQNDRDTKGKGIPLVADALAYIQAHCLSPISPRDVAAAVHKTPAHMTAMLKKHTGFSAGQWITSGRLHEAARRLTHTEESLEEIAENVGWKDVTHFIRQFKKEKGITPAAWRARSN